MLMRAGLLAIASVILGASGDAPRKLMTPADLQALPAQPADATIRYGTAAAQFGDLRVPSGEGPHPVVVLIHGSCFKAAYATLSDLAPMADALKKQGVATWNIEYRRLGLADGRWPETYRDIAWAIDHLRTIAPRHQLDLSRVVIVGHSAGGHLALWAAARHRLLHGSALKSADPVELIGTINLAGPIDMRENIANYQAACRGPVVHQLLGGTPRRVPSRYTQVSAPALLPLGVPQVLIWGEHETFVPLPLARSYVTRARAAGDDARLRVVPGAGDFEIASPHSAAWPAVRDEIERLLRRR